MTSFKQLSDKQIKSQAEQLFKRVHKIPDADPKSKRISPLKKALREFKGSNIDVELPLICEDLKCNINVFYYDVQTDRFELDVSCTIDERYDTGNLLKLLNVDADGKPILNDDGSCSFHILGMTNAEEASGILVCPHCNKYTFNKFKDPKHIGRFHKHMDKCILNEGKPIKRLQLKSYQEPYVPHILKNPIYAYLLAHGLKQHFKPTSNFITYDFETIEQPLDLESSTSTTVHAKLIPFMVSSCTHTNSTLNTSNFCMATDDDFITTWLKYLFAQAEHVSYANTCMYEHLFDQHPNLKALVVSKASHVPVIGFNSGKFDIKLFVTHLATKPFKIVSIIGSIGCYKSIVVSMEGCPYHLKFLDAKAFIGGGSLDSFTKDFSDSSERTKAFFPYQFITINNWQTELYKHEPFTHDSFYSGLTQENISPAEYETYVELQSHYETRLDYFIKYCNLDVEIMVQPLLYLINETAAYMVDMLSQLSLSSNAAMIKYSFGYRTFDPTQDYDMQCDSNDDEPYYLSEKNWAYKVDSYRKQDITAKRNADDNVTQADFKYYHELMTKERCHLCNSRFHKNNKPTLDRLDNSLGHSKANTKLACEYCNVYRSNKTDTKLIRLYLTLRKYAIKFNLPMTLAGFNGHDAYHILRNAIT